MNWARTLKESELLRAPLVWQDRCHGLASDMVQANKNRQFGYDGPQDYTIGVSVQLGCV